MWKRLKAWYEGEYIPREQIRLINVRAQHRGEPVDDFVKVQLEYARKLRLHQDLLRYAIPAAYFTFIGGALKSISDENLTALAWAAFTAVGVVTYIATISEHYFYAAFRNWERHLESLAIDPTYKPVLTKAGTSVAPGQAAKAEELTISEPIDVRTWGTARKLKDISEPNLAHPTMLAVLLGIALSVAVYVDRLAFALLPSPDLLGPSCGVVAVVSLLLIYRYWHRFYKTAVVWLLNRLETR
jgi:hypothetical protein